MIRNLFRRIREAGKRADAVLSVAPPKPLPPTVKAANEALNEAVDPHKLKEMPKPLHVAETSKENSVSFNPKPFFAELRKSGLRHRTPEQVAGTEAIIAAMKGHPISWVAYALATAWHETGGKMQPNVESLNYSTSGLLKTFSRTRISRADAEALGRNGPRPANQRAIGNIVYGGNWGRVNLGNTEPNDGWTYRGRGLEHVTGRRNYQRTGEVLGIDLLANPDALLDLQTAVRSLVTGMETGRYVSGHNLQRHLPATREGTAVDFKAARRIINGVDKADTIAGYAMTFQAALRAGGWA